MKSKSYLTALVFLAAGLILLLVSITSIPAENSVQVPDGYVKLCSISLKEIHKDSSVYEIKLDQTKQVNFYLWSNSSQEKRVILEGPPSSRIVLMEGKAKMSDVGFKLEAGEYRIMLNNEASRGELYIFMKQ